MAKFRLMDNTKGVFEFFCPGCKIRHSVWTTDESYPHPVWKFNNNNEKPTIHPSLMVTYNYGSEHFICHSFITFGKIQFLSDCTHELKGQTVELPEFS